MAGPVDSSVYYGTRYWNDHEAVRRHLNQRATGDPDVVWYQHAATFVGRPFAKALVLNCGNGWVERELLAAGVVAEAVGVDISPELLQRARDAAGDLPLRYYELDVNAGVLPEDGFDVVVNHAAGHHLTHLDRVLRAVASALPPDGWLLSWDYVGPHRNQYPWSVMEAAHALNRRLPDHLRASLGYPHLPTMVATDPSEAVHSELYEAVLDRYFDLRHHRALGGALAYQLLTFNDAFFDAEPHEVDQWLRLVLDEDAAATDAGLVPTLFAYALAQPRPGALADEDRLAAWTAEEDAREAAAVERGGVYYEPTYLQQVTQELEDERIRVLQLATPPPVEEPASVKTTILRHPKLAPVRRVARPVVVPVRDKWRSWRAGELGTDARPLADFGARLDANGLRHALGGDVEQWAPFLRFAGPGHFYSPIPRLDEIAADADRIWDRHDRDLPGIDLRREQQRALIVELAGILADEQLPEQPDPAWRYHSDNFAYGIGDGLVLHGMIRKHRPKRIIEVGSGFSSALILDTVERFLPADTEVTFVEPYPELLLSRLRPGDRERVTILTDRVQDVPADVFARLEPGDLLFIDSTHVVRTGSDVLRLVFEVLPALPPGVLVHVHDIFWPFEQPRPWVEEGRQWAETYLLRAFLMFNPSFEIQLWNDWLAIFNDALLREHLPRFLRNCGGAIWLQRTA